MTSSQRLLADTRWPANSQAARQPAPGLQPIAPPSGTAHGRNVLSRWAAHSCGTKKRQFFSGQQRGQSKAVL